MRKVFFFPQYPKGKAVNPYCDNFIESIKNYFVIIPKSRYSIPRGLELLIGSIKADIYIINWLENISNYKGGSFQAMMGIIALFIIKIRRKKIVWMFHNIHPHNGENMWSKIIQRILFTKSYLIISHSAEASKYARHFSKCPVFFKNHPLLRIEYEKWEGNTRNCDFFFWSKILPYKGVPEFLANPQCKNSGKKIYILGKCQDTNLCKKIESLAKGNIIFENRKANYDEIASQCRMSKYVIFPYIGEGISSSGVLMDTLLMGGTPVGPNRGAFADLAAQGCCITYNNIDEIFGLPTEEKQCIKLDKVKVDKFIDENSWKSFGKWFYTKVQ